MCVIQGWGDLVYPYIAKIQDKALQKNVLEILIAVFSGVFKKNKALTPIPQEPQKSIMRTLESSKSKLFKETKFEETKTPKNKNKKNKNKNKKELDDDKSCILSEVASSVATFLTPEEFANRLNITRFYDVANASDLEDFLCPSSEVVVQCLALWNTILNTEHGFTYVIKPSTQENIEIFAEHSGHHFISDVVQKKYWAQKKNGVSRII